MKPYLIITYLISVILLGSLSDALFDDGIKIWGHAIDAVETGLLISGAFLFSLSRRYWLSFFLSYVFIRVAGFDYMYNLFRGLPIEYVGGTGWWDIMLSSQEPGGIAFGKAIFLITGISIPIKYL